MRVLARLARFLDEATELEARIADYRDIIASKERQRTIIVDELTEIVDKHGDDRRTQILHGFDGDVSIEDLTPEEQVVVSLTHGGYIKRTRIDQYRAQHRGGKGVKGAQLRSDDVVFITAPFSGYGTAPNGGSIDIVDEKQMAELGTRLRTDTMDDYADGRVTP